MLFLIFDSSARLWAASSSCRWPFSLQWIWTRWTLKVPSNSSYSVILCFCIWFFFFPSISLLYFMQPLCHYCKRTSMISFGKFYKVVVGVGPTVPEVRATVYCKPINCNVFFVTFLTRYGPNSLSLHDVTKQSRQSFFFWF